MGIGTVTQVLYIRTLPPGVTMKITNAELKYPHDGDWWPTLAGGGKLLTKNSTPAQKPICFHTRLGLTSMEVVLERSD